MRANFAKLFVGCGLSAAVLVTLGTLTFHLLRNETPVMANVAAIDRPVPQSAPPATQPAKSLGDQISDQLSSDDPSERQKAIDKIRGLEDDSPKTIAESLADWRPMLMAAKEYQLVEDLGMIAINARPYDITIVQSAQKGRVMALLAEEKCDQALAEARSFYNVATLKSTNDAIDLLYRALDKTRDSATASAFKMQQIADGDTPPATVTLAAFTNSDPATHPAQSNLLDSIDVEPDIYASTLNTVGISKGYKNLVSRGYLYLLCNRSTEAQKCFEDACKLANGGGRQLREAVEGIAQSMRAQDGNVARANAFILSIQQDPTPLVSKLVPRTKDGPEKLRLAAQQTVLAQVNMMNVPPLEEARAKSEDATADIHIAADFDCATPIDVTKISPTHFRVAITTNGFRDWFMFRLNGVAGKTIRIDLTGDNIEMFKWWSLNPLYTYSTDTNALETYTTVPARQPPDLAWNGAELPPTDGQAWHFIPGVWREGPTNTLSLVQHFAQDHAVIAMRVPYTPGYNQKYLAQVASASDAKVIQVGQSAQGRPLQLALVGDDPLHPRPCVLIYAREHADEHDTSWVAQGALEYLISDDPQAQALRQQFTFIVIPLLDPDSAAASLHEVMMTSFLPGKTTAESVAYANWFKSWIDAGERLDLVFDLHNVQSRENPQICCPLIEGIGDRGRAAMAMHNMLVNRLQSADYTVVPRPWSRGLTPDRLGGWLSVAYGPYTLAYEFNSQDAQRHLNLVGLKRIGEIFVKTSAEFLTTSEGTAAMAQVDAHRRHRLERWSHTPSTQPAGNAIDAEAAHSASAQGGNDTAAAELITN